MLTDNAFVGQLRCIRIDNQPWNFYWNQDGVPGHAVASPICFNNPVGTYYAFAAHDTRKGIEVFGGAEGYVNPNNNEKASVVFIPPHDGVVTMKVYSLRGKLMARIDTVFFREQVIGNGSQYALSWDAHDSTGRAAPTGIYVAHITGAGMNERVKIAVVNK